MESAMFNLYYIQKQNAFIEKKDVTNMIHYTKRFQVHPFLLS